jgi:hypothetical protein
MGSSLIHWLLVLLVLVLVLAPIIFGLLLINRTRARTWLARLSEHQSYSTVGETKEETPGSKLVREIKEETPSSILFKLLIYSWLLILTSGLFFVRRLEPFFSSKQPSYAAMIEVIGILNGLGILAPALCFIIAAIIHFQPNHSRLLKYFFLLLPLPFENLFYLPTALLSRQSSGSLSTFFIECLILFSVISWGLTLSAALMIFGIYWLKQTEITTRSFSRYEYSVFHFIRMKWIGPFMFILLWSSKDLLLVLLVVRYIAIERFRQRPIVYLRSFQHQYANQVFGRTIAPALSSYGVIMGLVHNLQTGSRLFSRTSLWQFGWMAVVPDGRWQEWVSTALNRASLAIVDCSVVTESVLWEIRTAVNALDVTRIAVIRGTHDSNCHDFAGVQVFESSNENSQVLRQLKKKLHRWGKITSRGLQQTRMYQIVIAWMLAVMALCILELLSLIILYDLNM